MTATKKKEGVMSLTNKEIEILVKTSDEELLSVFPKSKYGLTRRELRKIKREELAKLESSMSETLQKHKESKERKSDNSVKNELLEKIDSLERELDAVAQIKVTPQEYKIHGKSDVQIEAVPFIIASDWHVEEIVKKDTVSGLNEFTLEIAERRINYFFKNAVKLLQISRKDVVVKNAVIALLGDFISGNIHEELLENTSMRPVEAMLWVQRRLIGGIKYILENTDLDFIIVCHPGNHPRITKRIHISNESGNSLEYFMYHNLRSVFENEKRLTFIIAEGYHTYLNLFGRTIRFHHGHSIKFNKNVGGIFPTVYKAIMQWNKGRHADLDVFGHFHQMRNGGNFICNGSLIGYNAFAIFITAEYERPRQKFFLFTSTGEVTQECPIFLDV